MKPGSEGDEGDWVQTAAPTDCLRRIIMVVVVVVVKILMVEEVHIKSPSHWAAFTLRL